MTHMDQLRQERNIKALWALVLLGISCSSLLYYQIVPTGLNNAEGAFGVLLAGCPSVRQAWSASWRGFIGRFF